MHATRESGVESRPREGNKRNKDIIHGFRSCRRVALQRKHSTANGSYELWLWVGNSIHATGHEFTQGIQLTTNWRVNYVAQRLTTPLKAIGVFAEAQLSLWLSIMLLTFEVRPCSKWPPAQIVASKTHLLWPFLHNLHNLNWRQFQTLKEGHLKRS